MAWVRDKNGKWIWAGPGPQIGGPPQIDGNIQQDATGGVGGGGAGGGQAAGFELPDWLRKRLGGGVSEYNMPSSLQSLLWSNVLAGQVNIDWSQMPRGQAAKSGWWQRQLQANPQLAQLMTDYFGVEAYAQQTGIDIGDIGQRGRFTYGGAKYPMGMQPSEVIGMDPAFANWQMRTARAMTEGGPAGARTSGFLPDKAAHMAELQGTLTEYAAQLGVNREAFEANLAQRGVSGAGQATEARYRDVTAPVMRAGGQAIRQSFLDYLQAYQRGSIAAEGFRQQDISRLTGTELAVGQMEQTTRAQNLNRLLEGYLGQGQLDLGFQGLELQTKVANREFAFRAYENRLKEWMFQEEMRQRQRESQSNWWSNFFGGLFGVAGQYAGAKAGK